MMTTNAACRICRSTDLRRFISFGAQPPANRFIKAESPAAEPAYPLDVYWCGSCNLVQLIDVVDKRELFSDYIYFSSGMPKLSDHFLRYANDVMTRHHLQPGDLVVEIASNDGILLKHFKDHGYRTLGIDPAENIVPVAERLGVETLCEFFSEPLAETIAQSRGKAKVILGNNVVAHINDHHDLAKGIAALLADDGVFVLEAPYLVDMFENLTYDTIYHEHLSMLAIRPLQKLFATYGLEIFEAEVHPVQGQSLRAYVGKAGKRQVQPSVDALVRRELALGFDTFDAYQKLAGRIEASKAKLLATLRALQAEGKRIAAYGAPAKGNTVLNYATIGPDLIEFALEDLPSKQGLLTPGMRIPVKDRAYAEAHAPDVYLLLAWNYLKPIMAKESKFLAGGGAFVMPIGDEISVVRAPAYA